MTTNAPTGTAPLNAPGTATDLTLGGTNSLQGQALTFKTSAGTLSLTLSNVAGAGKVNSIDALNTALTNGGVGLTASFNAAGTITFTSTNDSAGQVITNSGTAPTAAGTVDISRWCGHHRPDRHRGCCGSCLAGHPLEPGQAVQRHHHADHDHVAGFVLQRHQPLEWR